MHDNIMSTGIHPLIKTFQNTNTPDINLERDVITPEIDAEIPLGMEAAKLSTDKKFIVNVSTILISALLFLMILAWFDFMQTTFYIWLAPEDTNDFIPSSVKFWYAIFITVFVLILVVLIYYYSRKHML